MSTIDSKSSLADVRAAVQVNSELTYQQRIDRLRATKLQ